MSSFQTRMNESIMNVNSKCTSNAENIKIAREQVMKEGNREIKLNISASIKKIFQKIELFIPNK